MTRELAAWLLLLPACAAPGPTVLAPGDASCSDPAAWRVEQGMLELWAPSRYDPPVRSPRSLAVWPIDAGDLVLEARVQQTSAEYGHRDLCLCFGFVDPRRFYYVHMASRADDHAHGAFLVDGAPRVKLPGFTTAGVAWGEGWHDVRLERVLADGRITVWLDGVKVIEAHDRTLGRGRVGVGSFDDTGRFADVRLWAPQARRAEGGVEWKRPR